MESNPKGSAAAGGAAAAGAGAVFGFLLDDDDFEEDEEVFFVATPLLLAAAASLSHQALSIYFILIQERKCCKSLLLCGAFVLAVRGSYRARYFALTASLPAFECCNLVISSAVNEEWPMPLILWLNSRLRVEEDVKKKNKERKHPKMCQCQPINSIK